MLIFIFLSFLAPLLVYSQCCFPGGDLAASDVPCNSHAYTTLCCPEGWTCFSNNLCVVTDSSTTSYDIGSSRRGTCTNPNWDEGNCGSFCLRNPVNDNSGDLVPCGDNRFCCAADVRSDLCNCSSSGDHDFILDSGDAYTVIGVSNLDYTSTSEVSVSSLTTSSPAGPSLTTILSSVLIHTTVVVSVTNSGPASTITQVSVTMSTVTVATSRSDNMKTVVPSTQPLSISSQISHSSSQSATSVSSSTPLSSSSTTCSADGAGTTSNPSSCEDRTTQAARSVTDTTAFKAGVGAGIPGFVLLALLLFLFFRWYRRSRDDEEDKDEPTQHSFSLMRDTVRQVPRRNSATHSPYIQGAPNNSNTQGAASRSADLLRAQGQPDPYEPPAGMPLSDISSNLSTNPNESNVGRSRSQFVPPQRGNDPYEPPGGSPRRSPAVGMHSTQQHPMHNSFTIQRRPTPSQRYENPDSFHQTQTFPRVG